MGFILRANQDVAQILHAAIKDKSGESQASQKLHDLSLTLLDPMKRTHGLTLNNKLYLCTLADLPCIIEAQKTLDYSTFYKSCDASQIMYVHNTCLDNMQARTQEEVQRFVAQFCPLDDEDFKMDLYQRKKL